MSHHDASPFDLDHFYSAESVGDWQQIIGDALHYHFGYFRGAEPLEVGLKQTVRNFYPYLEPGSRVFDLGCGWGGPAKMLIEEHHCTVTGLSSSAAQVDYCRSLGLNVRQQDVEHEQGQDLLGDYDAIFCLEMISHIRDKAKLLRRLRSCAPRLILSESCAADTYGGPRTTFGGSIALCTVSELVHDVEAAGWTIQFMQDRRFHSLRTVSLWQQNLDRVYGDDKPPGQLGVLRSLVKMALASPIHWCQSFPLIDIVADGGAYHA